MSGTALILGASGKIGRHSAKAFADAGWDVRPFDRQKGDMVAQAQGVDLIVNGMNPPNYHDWANIIPAVTRQLIEAAEKNGASIILPGNVYHFGDQPGVWSEHTPPKPVSRKGHIRLEMEEAYKASGIQTIVLRAGNFIDPDRQNCVMSTIYLRQITKGKIVLPGPAHVRQAMCFLPDWARAAVKLAEMRENLKPFEDIPFPGHTTTAAEIKSVLESSPGHDLKFTKFPWWLMRLLSPAWELARELTEMRYLWNTDHALCDKRFKSLLPDFQETDLETALTSALPTEHHLSGNK